MAILSLGAIGNTVEEAIRSIEQQYPDRKGMFAHYDMRWLKPIDTEILDYVGTHYQEIVTVEDGMIQGGLGSAVLEHIADHRYTTHVTRLGIDNQFVEHGSTKELYHLLKLDTEGLCESLLSVPVK